MDARARERERERGKGCTLEETDAGGDRFEFESSTPTLRCSTSSVEPDLFSSPPSFPPSIEKQLIPSKRRLLLVLHEKASRDLRPLHWQHHLLLLLLGFLCCVAAAGSRRKRKLRLRKEELGRAAVPIDHRQRNPSPRRRSRRIQRSSRNLGVKGGEGRGAGSGRGGRELPPNASLVVKAFVSETGGRDRVKDMMLLIDR